MTKDMTVMTKIAHDLLVLQQRRATGELVITPSQATSPQWRLYFYLGRLVYATGGKHPVRRWYRAFKHHCTDATAMDWLTEARSDHALWEVDLLNQAVSQGYISAAVAKAIVQDIVREVVFAFIGKGSLDSSWHPGKPITQQATVLSVEQVLEEAQQLRQQWQSSGLGHLQDLLTQFSPDLAPVIRDSEQLRSKASPVVYKNLIRLMQGKKTLWDVALHTQRSLPILIRFLLPLIRQGVIELKEIPDLPAHWYKATVATHPRKPAKLIACIDDSPVIGQMLTQILQPAGYEVLTILNPLQGIANLLDRKPDLIFLDLVMPNTNGYELCTFLRKTSAFQDTPIVILTGHDGVVDRVRAKLAGSSDFLSKPPEPHKVLQVVQKYLGEAIAVDVHPTSNFAIA